MPSITQLSIEADLEPMQITFFCRNLIPESFVILDMYHYVQMLEKEDIGP